MNGQHQTPKTSHETVKAEFQEHPQKAPLKGGAVIVNDNEA
jgi:hypothetical protein